MRTAELTAEQIDVMPAGRELDALVAEAMGVAFVRKTMNAGEPYESEILVLTRNGEPYLVHGWLMHGMVYPEVLGYSTNIEAAMRALDQVTDHGQPCEIEYHLVGSERFSSVMLNTCSEHRGISLSGLPHAICRAVLKAALTPAETTV